MFWLAFVRGFHIYNGSGTRPYFMLFKFWFRGKKYICMSNSLKSVKKTYSGKSDSTAYYFRISSFRRDKYEFVWNLKTHARKTNKQFVLPENKIKFLQMYGDSHLFPKL